MTSRQHEASAPRPAQPGRGASSSSKRGQPDTGSRRARHEHPATRRALGGLAVTATVFVVGGFGLRPMGSLLVLGAPTTFAMPVLAAIADWGAGVRGRWAAAVNSLLVVVSAAVLTLLGQLLVGHADIAGATRTTPAGSGQQMPTFPYEIPLGALAFVTFLQVSVVSEGRLVLPARYGPKAGRLAVLGCLAVALTAYAALANWGSATAEVRRLSLWDPHGPFDALDIAAWLISVAIWQTAHGLLDGWPYSLVKTRPARVALANVTVLALGSATYAIATGPLGMTGPQLSAAGAMFVVGASISGPLLNGWPLAGARTACHRTWLAVSATGIAAAAYITLHRLGLAAEHRWTPQAPVELWMVICGLNLIGGTIPWYTQIARPQAL
ncbi:hypothetical protein [Actinacidiphila acididurans]|uniref:Uncharacterized protein n=1 Tax=Actinacidiphila acididurans TaxID=2784346 RepID=A0ABS2TTH1_9ACTN|nr:hypothetical protein [Actinacidiphila acididurans]MBM9506634.1 hypothetical protein [Actinacidiphila acididurans]